MTVESDRNVERNYLITLKKGLYFLETDTWTGGRDDVIFCEEYDLDEQELTCIRTSKSLDIVIVNRDNVAGIVHNTD